MTQEIAGVKVALNQKTLIKCINFPNPNTVLPLLRMGLHPNETIVKLKMHLILNILNIIA